MMTTLIKKGGLRERANRSRKYQGSENTETRLIPNSYSGLKKTSQVSDFSDENKREQHVKEVELHPTITTTQK